VTPAIKARFSRFLGALPGRLHFAAHSHHPWPDISFDAQQRAWLDAAAWMDAKWERIFGEILPRSQAHVARLLNLPDPRSVCFAQNTHELVMRLLSGIERAPLRVLTTDSEFHSFTRQLRRLEDAGIASVERVAVEPFETFPTRFADAMATHPCDLIYFSQVFYNSGYAIENLPALVAAVRRPTTLVVIDGYHGFMALTTDLSAIANRAFYLAGGYKYAMSGEGACFMHCPPGYVPRPLDTGWFAGFAALGNRVDEVAFPTDGLRFLGATFDPTGLYRFNAVMDWLLAEGLTPGRIHTHAWTLQATFLNALMKQPPTGFATAELLPAGPQPRGNFLTFRHTRAADICKRLHAQNVVTDYRDDRLRIGFGLYQDDADVAELLERFRLVVNAIQSP
jgi:selenocysteine lyase/cysteine desulfurase